jgi:hypothetical protein
MQPHQERVINEKSELDEKLAKLHKFLHSDFYQQLSSDERMRLLRQSIHMEDYTKVLGERIVAFE